jgi:Leucine-rich repeat (LRR) protein
VHVGEELDLVQCELTSLPAAIGKLTNLRKLNLSENKNLAHLPRELAQCTQLDYLLLCDCPNARAGAEHEREGCARRPRWRRCR